HGRASRRGRSAGQRTSSRSRPSCRRVPCVDSKPSENWLRVHHPPTCLAVPSRYLPRSIQKVSSWLRFADGVSGVVSAAGALGVLAGERLGELLVAGLDRLDL